MTPTPGLVIELWHIVIPVLSIDLSSIDSQSLDSRPYSYSYKSCKYNTTSLPNFLEMKTRNFRPHKVRNWECIRDFCTDLKGNRVSDSGPWFPFRHITFPLESSKLVQSVGETWSRRRRPDKQLPSFPWPGRIGKNTGLRQQTWISKCPLWLVFSPTICTGVTIICNGVSFLSTWTHLLQSWSVRRRFSNRNLVPQIRGTGFLM